MAVLTEVKRSVVLVTVGASQGRGSGTLYFVLSCISFPPTVSKERLGNSYIRFHVGNWATCYLSKLQKRALASTKDDYEKPIHNIDNQFPHFQALCIHEVL